MKRLIAAICAVLWVVLLFWAFGFDFSDRGFSAGYLVVCATFAAVGAATAPFKD